MTTTTDYTGAILDYVTSHPGERGSTICTAVGYPRSWVTPMERLARRGLIRWQPLSAEPGASCGWFVTAAGLEGVAG